MHNNCSYTFKFLFQDFDKADIDKKEDSKDKKEETKEREFQLSYIAAPKKTLNLVNIPAKRDWVSKAEELIKSDKSKNRESRKVRKKRLWLERKGVKGKIIRKTQARYLGDWEYLPDLCLELIFQYLTFEVSQRERKNYYSPSIAPETSQGPLITDGQRSNEMFIFPIHLW